MALALVAGLAAPGTEGPGPPTPTLTLGGGFVTGQRAQPGWAGKVRVNGATAWAQVARGPWSIQAGWVGQHEAVTVDPAPVDPAADPAEPPPEPGPTLAEGGPAWDQAAGALATYAHPWFAMGLGVGWRRTLSRRRDTARADDRVLPVGHVRLGPPWLHADGAWLDPTATPGHARAGIGSHLKGGRVWAGAAWRADHDLALAATGRVPLDGGLFLSVGAALDPADPARWLELQGGLGFAFGEAAAAEGPASRPGKDAEGSPPGPAMPPAGPRPPADPLGDPL